MAENAPVSVKTSVAPETTVTMESPMSLYANLMNQIIVGLAKLNTLRAVGEIDVRSIASTICLRRYRSKHAKACDGCYCD